MISGMKGSSSAVPALTLLAFTLITFMLMGSRIGEDKVPDNAAENPLARETPQVDPTRDVTAIGNDRPTNSSREITPIAPATPLSTSTNEPVVQAKVEPVEKPTSTQTPYKTHVVEAGETLTGIAELYGTSIEAIVNLNSIVDPHALFVGQSLKVPSGSTEDFVDTIAAAEGYKQVALGSSAGGYPIESYVVGSGRHHVAVVGAVHGGYEWNTAVLAYRLLTYFVTYTDTLPAGITLHLIPVANPDGMVEVTGQPGPLTALHVRGDTFAGRFNANQVDLNRNWDCFWQAEGVWRQEPVSGGQKPFSEPETQALRDYFQDTEFRVVIFLHSAAGLVAPGNCGQEHRPSETASNLYGEAAGYSVGGFTAYQVTGDAASWLASQDVASFTVELTDHEDIEFGRNLSGLLELLNNIDTIR